MPIEPNADDELRKILENAGTMFDEKQVQHRQLLEKQNTALREKGLLPDEFSSTIYNAYVQPEDPSVSSEEIAENRWQIRRFPRNRIQILWDWEFDPEKGVLISTVGNPSQPPNGIAATRSGMVLQGPEIEGSGLPMMVIEE